MNCLKCNQETIQNMWGDWCNTCGGIMLGNPPKLFFRHVATVDGAGGRFPIVYDLSTEQYGVSWPRLVANVRCIHCSQETPVEIRKGLANLDDIKPSGFFSKRGTLDEMIAFIQPHAKGLSEELPELSIAPQANAQEIAILQL